MSSDFRGVSGPARFGAAMGEIEGRAGRIVGKGIEEPAPGGTEAAFTSRRRGLNIFSPGNSDSDPGRGPGTVTSGEVCIESRPGKGSNEQDRPRTEGVDAREGRGAEASAPNPGKPAVEADSEEETRPRPSVRVLLAEDHEVVRRGIANLIAEDPELELVGEASNGEEAIILAHDTRPDVLVMDISLPGISGIEATRQLIRETPDTRIIAFSMHERHDVAEALKDAGAVAFVSKSEPSEHLIRAIREWGGRRGA